MSLKIPASEIVSRPVNPRQDLPFILSTWLKSYRDSAFANCIPNDEYYQFQQDRITQILLHPDNAVTVICDPAAPEVILAYSVYNTREPLVHYIYVKFKFRKFGLGRMLLMGVKAAFPNEFVTCTHIGRKWHVMAKKYHLKYNPYIISGVLPHDLGSGSQPADIESETPTELVQEQF